MSRLGTSLERVRIPFLSFRAKQVVRRFAGWPLPLLATAGGLIFALLGKLDRIAPSCPIFIVGCSRSGTTLIHDVITATLDVHGWSEAGQVFEPRYFDPTVDHRKTAADVIERDRARVVFALGSYSRLAGRGRRLVVKSCENSLRIPYLLDFFPDARFLHVIRDGRAVVCSALAACERDDLRQEYPLGLFPKPVGWRELAGLSAAEQFAEQWVRIVETVRVDALRYLDERSYMEVRYEAFCERPEANIAEISSWLGLNRGRAKDVSPRPRSQDHKWRRDLGEEDLFQIRRIADGMLERLGYR